MHIEVPEFKKCCFCMPLRYGLLTWGYIKLVASIVMLFYSFILAMLMFGFLRSTDGIMAFGFTFTELIFCVVLIVGAHKKKLSLLRMYYHYNIMEAILFVIVYTVFTFFAIVSRSHNIRWYYEYIVIDVAFGIIFIAIEVYVILLLRSELLKLKNNHSFRFVNNAAESDYTPNTGHINENGIVE